MARDTNYNVQDALLSAFPKPLPIPEAKPGHYNTGRSGLRVDFSAPRAPTPENHHRVEVNINGPVDKHDAAQLAYFFTALGAKLEELGSHE